MKICIAQIKPFKGDIQKNINAHLRFINVAVSYGATLIVFPELSLTGYEPELAKELATTQEDKKLDEFQKISDMDQISICLGIPTKTDSGILISMIIFQPHAPRQTYSKQHLHPDEGPYFVCGARPLILTLEDKKIAPAICYESLLPAHSEHAHKNGAEFYIASVAKPANGVNKAFQHFPDIANKYSMTVLMANCVGYCDNFESVGKSSVWNNQGVLLAQLNDTNEGILILDTDTQEVIEKII
jgi:predicted amidohydrolase